MSAVELPGGAISIRLIAAIVPPGGTLMGTNFLDSPRGLGVRAQRGRSIPDASSAYHPPINPTTSSVENFSTDARSAVGNEATQARAQHDTQPGSLTDG